MPTYMRNGVAVPMTPAMTAAVAVEGDLPIMRRSVGKLLIVDRLIGAGLASAAMAALASDPVAKMRWDAAVSIYADDAAVIGLLTAIGADPAAILAP